MTQCLRVKHYFRYADDFIIVHSDKDYLVKLLPLLKSYLNSSLFLELHPHKISIRKLSQGIDWLGYIILPHYTLLRTKTKNRMFKRLVDKKDEYLKDKLTADGYNQSLQSYLGLLKHCSSYKVKKQLKKVLEF